jgi:PqqD family protein of HPr-rel-A system
MRFTYLVRVTTTATQPSDADGPHPIWRLLRDGLIWRALDDDLIVFCGRSGATHRLLHAEAWIFERLTDGPATSDELIAEIRKDATPESAMNADGMVRTTLELFEQLGLITSDVAASDDMNGLLSQP